MYFYVNIHIMPNGMAGVTKSMIFLLTRVGPNSMIAIV